MKWIILIPVVASLSSCLDRNCYKFYAFEFPLTVTPQDTFMIGDTIWWEMNVPNQAFDKSTGDYIDITDFEFYLSLMVSEVDSTQPFPMPSLIDEFIIVQDIGRLEPTNRLSNKTYVKTYSIQDKIFRFGLISNRVGTFSCSLFWPRDYYDLEQEYRDPFFISDPNCWEFITLDSKIVVNNGETNYHMLAGTCNRRSDGSLVCYDSTEIYGSGTYSFHVKAP